MPQLVQHHGNEVHLAARGQAVSPVIPGEAAVEARGDLGVGAVAVGAGELVDDRNREEGRCPWNVRKARGHAGKPGRAQHVGAETCERGIDHQGHAGTELRLPDLDCGLERGLRLRGEAGVIHRDVRHRLAGKAAGRHGILDDTRELVVRIEVEAADRLDDGGGRGRRRQGRQCRVGSRRQAAEPGTRDEAMKGLSLQPYTPRPRFAGSREPELLGD